MSKAKEYIDLQLEDPYNYYLDNVDRIRSGKKQIFSINEEEAIEAINIQIAEDRQKAIQALIG